MFDWNWLHKKLTCIFRNVRSSVRFDFLKFCWSRISLKAQSRKKYLLTFSGSRKLMKNIVQIYKLYEIWLLNKYRLHFVKSVEIRCFFWSVFSCIRTEYRKIRTKRTPYLYTFHAVSSFWTHFMSQHWAQPCRLLHVQS